MITRKVVAATLAFFRSSFGISNDIKIPIYAGVDNGRRL